MSCGSFNNYARRVHDWRLSYSERAGALRSCIRLVWERDWRQYSYSKFLRGVGKSVDADLCNITDEKPLLKLLIRLERTRNRILEARFAFERKRIRQKMRGQRVPRKADIEELTHRINEIKRDEWEYYLQLPGRAADSHRFVCCSYICYVKYFVDKSKDRKQHWYYRLLRVVLFVVLFLFGVRELLLFGVRRLHWCTNSVERTVVSPDGKLKAVAFLRDCGAAPGFSRGVAILRVNETLRDEYDGNACSIDGPEEGGDVQPKWKSNHEVTIYNKSSHFWMPDRVTVWNGTWFTTVKLHHGPIQASKN